MADIAKIVEEVKTLTVLELNDLVKALEEEFGVSAAAAVAAPAAGGLSRRSEKSFPVSRWSTLRLWSKAPRRPSKKASARKLPNKSPKNLRRQAPKSKLNNCNPYTGTNYLNFNSEFMKKLILSVWAFFVNNRETA